ncbi:hypothetical protein [Mesorhizobium sp. Cs1299R1N3]
MPKSIYDRGRLKPDEVATLQRVFQNAGMVDEEMLTEAVGFRRLEPKSA